MTVKQLKALLANCDDDQIVVVAHDAEGNGYSVLGGVSDGWWNTKYLEFDAEECKRGVAAICVWPA
jgi:hypothetical protein